ncbi:MAG: antitermination protein NusB, partial [Paraeggerthella sp.]|nr:antitermination protein NusB [Paraeggerthella sp.]
QGKILVSDAASQLVAASVLPQDKPASMLEVGAGRATKTILLQSAAQRTWGSQIESYVTLDNHGFKTKLLLERAARYGSCVSEALTGDALALGNVVRDRLFDVVFIDAPCSGLGTLRRHPEIRWRLQPEDVAAFAKTQLGMLRAAAGHVAPGGTLAYATCTVTCEEDNQTVKAFLASEEGQRFQLAPIAGRSCLATRLAPGSSDAHFAVRFARVS